MKAILAIVALGMYTCDALLAEGLKQAETAKIHASLQAVAYELRELRRALAEDRLERQQLRVEALEAELADVRRERQDADELQRERQDEVSTLDRKIGDAATSAEQRADLQALRTELIGGNPHDSVGSLQKESAISEKLRQAYARLRETSALVQSLSGAKAQVRH